MKPLQLLATNDSPAINYNPEKNKFIIAGNSMPENSIGFYKQVLDWLKEYEKSPNKKSEFVFKMNLLNTSSTKIFMDIFKIIKQISEKSLVIVYWYYAYGDDDIQEVGVDFKEFVDVNFELVPVSDFELN